MSASKIATVLRRTFGETATQKQASSYDHPFSRVRDTLPQYIRRNPHIAAPAIGGSLGALQGAVLADNNEWDHPLAATLSGAAVGTAIGAGAGLGARRNLLRLADKSNLDLEKSLLSVGREGGPGVHVFHDKALRNREMLDQAALSEGWGAVGKGYFGGVLGGALGAHVTNAALAESDKTAAVLQNLFGV